MGTETGLETRPQETTIQALRGELSDVCSQAGALQVVDEATARTAAELLRAIKAGIARGQEIWKPVKRSLDKAKRDALDGERDMLEPWVEADRRLRARLLAWETERRQAEQRTRREAEEAERRRQEEERLQQAVRLENMAKATGDQAFARQAEQLLEAPAPVGVVAAAPRPALSGVSFPERVSVEVHNLAALVAAVAEGKVGLGAVKADTEWLRKQAVQDGEAFNVPGVTRVTGLGTTVRG